jgi:Prefoldin subunit
LRTEKFAASTALLYINFQHKLTYPSLNFLIQLQTIVDFSLSDQVYARAKLRDVDSVGLWLGAGIMVEYSLDEAQKLLVSLFLALFL